MMDFLYDLLQCLVALAAIAVILVLVLAHVTATVVDLTRHEKEKSFPTAPGWKELLPSIHDPASKELSVIVPAYNEELRMPSMLEEAMDYLEKRRKRQPSFTYEVLVVDDGSSDRTSEVAFQYTNKFGADKVRVLTLVKNRGKGGAVRMGAMSCRGRLILMADADGATKFADYEKVEAALEAISPKPDNMAITCGSRAHLEQDSVAERSMFRTFLMYGFHFLVWFFCVRGIKDTQCGFKLFTREAALKTFSLLHVERWAFDVELLYIAQCFKIPIGEVAVNWTEIEGSKLVPVWSWLQMGRDLVFIRLRYLTGVWRLDSPRKTD
ncbi:dolichyl-phosphate beta-glucosyltransferase [Gadus macrocephalus]|uniref:dolichyl-phosphate beta-glucosyltransferase n=1 Tax=Gadus macrocephalus TaxID=80720 RepID=UPI0028CB6A9C|nr:dolichyl-phosphate beta-glucosyltransferase [Gadus macrocephalus]